MIVTPLFVLVIALSGYMTKLPKDSRFILLKAFGLVVSESIVAAVAIGGLWWLTTATPLRFILLMDVESIFMVLLLFAVLVGIVLYWGQEWVHSKFKTTNQLLTMCEYMIQWGLIYITVYQVIFDSLFSKDGLTAIEKMNVTTPSDVMVLILPALISVWIGVILYKVKHRHL